MGRAPAFRDKPEPAIAAYVRALELNPNDANGYLQLGARPRKEAIATADASGVSDSDGINAATEMFQWQRDGVDIAGADAQLGSYVLTPDDVGKEISVTVSFTDLGDIQETVTSATLTPNAISIVVDGDATSETLNGGQGDDSLSGMAGDDRLIGDAGDDALDGGAGIDTASYSGSQKSYTLTLSPTGTSLTDRRADGNGTDTFIDMEFLDFDTDLLDGPFNLDVFAGPAGMDEVGLESIVELYIAYFNRAPDAVGLFFWGTEFTNGLSLEEMASLFINQDETRAAYPSTLSNSEFATAVYNNVLGRVPDQDGFDFWVGQLNGGSVGRDKFILSVLDGAKADAATDASQDFIDQQLVDRQYLTDKTDIGAYFSVHKGMSDVPNASATMALFDGSQNGIDAAVAAVDGFFSDTQDADTGEFLMPLVCVLDDPFMM